MSKNNNDILNEINDLKQKIDQYNYEYYVLDNPSVPDSVYDKAMLRLKSLEQEYPEYKTVDSPTNRVGGYVSKQFTKRKHMYMMLSLDNAFSEADLDNFDQSINSIVNTNKYVVEPKIDGLSISLIYENSKLKYAVTRGDGVYGEDVTANVYTIKSIPKYIHKKYSNLIVEVRGEVFIDKAEFNRINNSLPPEAKKFANPRNAASGSLRNLDSSICASRNLKAYFYYSPNTKDLNINTQIDLINWLKENKFPVSDEIRLVNNINDVKKRINEFINLRDKLTYQIDGIVIKVNEYDYYDEIGYTSKFPKWAIAYKFPAEIGLTKINNIVCDVGRTGKITYVAEVQPISLDGSVISRVTLNNADYIKAKDIRVNDYAFIYKAGDVIPYLDFVDLTRRTNECISFVETKYCPSCNSELVRINSDVDQRCINENCQIQQIKKISYFCERDCMNIVGLSDSIIIKLYEADLVKSIPDLYRLESKFNLLVESNLKIKDKLATKIITAINSSKINSLEKLINALSIRYVGKNTAKILAKHFKSMSNLMNATETQLATINEIGDTIATEVYNWFKTDKNIQLLNQLEQLGLNFEYISSINSNDLVINEEFNYKTFVITGSFEINRNEIKQFLEDNYSAKVVETISKKVDYLLVGENPGSKLTKAKELNIKILDDYKLIYQPQKQ